MVTGVNVKLAPALMMGVDVAEGAKALADVTRDGAIGRTEN